MFGLYKPTVEGFTYEPAADAYCCRTTVLAAHAGTQPLTVADVVKNPCVLEFLDLEERPGYQEMTWSRLSSTTCRPFWWN